MKSKRLTESLKESILKKLENSLFGKRIEGIELLREELAEDAWEYLHDEEKQKFMKSAPEGAFWYTTSLDFRVTDDNDRRVDYFTLYLKNAKPVFACFGRDSKVIEANSLLHTKREKIEELAEKIGKEKKALFMKTRQILNSVTTTGKLLEVWPEAIEYLPEDDIPTENLPAVQSTELNALIASLKNKE